MKHFQTSYRNINRIRKLKRERAKFFPKAKDVIEWFTILNNLIFNDELPMFNQLYIKSYRQYHALFQSWEEDGIRFNMLEMNIMFDNKQTFVEVLAHEMIHLYQYVNDQPLDHGPTFLKWRFDFKQKGLELYKVS